MRVPHIGLWFVFVFLSIGLCLCPDTSLWVKQTAWNYFCGLSFAVGFSCARKTPHDMSNYIVKLKIISQDAKMVFQTAFGIHFLFATYWEKDAIKGFFTILFGALEIGAFPIEYIWFLRACIEKAILRLKYSSGRLNRYYCCERIRYGVSSQVTKGSLITMEGNLDLFSFYIIWQLEKSKTYVQ